MSRSFAAIPAETLRTTPQSKDIAILRPANIPPVGVVVDINWSDYGAGNVKPNVNVGVNLLYANPRPGIDRVRSVKIDNSGNDAPVYVSFPDTQDVIACPPNALVWEPVVTNGKIANVIAEGFTTGNVGSTRLIFTNVYIDPYVNAEVDRSISLWKGSALIQRTNQTFPGYAPPALGDQKFTVVMPLDGVVRAIPQFHAPGNSLYITFIDAILYDSVGDSSNNNLIFKIVGASSNLFVMPFKSVPQIAANYSVFRFHGNMRLSADDFYTNESQFNTGGNAQVTFAFTINPL